MDKLGQEWVSAAVDGETDEQALAQLAADTDSHDKWQNYHMIGDAMRGELPQTIALDLSQSIADAIEQEPAILVPKQPEAPVEQVAVVPQPAKSSNVVPLFKQLGQYAIAASVALVAVIGVQNYNTSPEMDAAPLPVLSTRPLMGSVSPVSYQTGATQNANKGYNKEQITEQRRRINAYIQDHMLQQRINAPTVKNSKEERTDKPTSH